MTQMGLFFALKYHYDIYMDYKIELFQELVELYSKNGFQLYMVGGSVRDYLLNLPLNDMDLVTDATPELEKSFLEHADYTFAKFGSIKLLYKGVKFDITTLRKENGYSDSRHPGNIQFTNKLDVDVLRRDITINALYLTKDLKVIDFVNGVDDLSNQTIRMIGDPLLRIKEDPLRIVRIYRFKYDLGFKIEPNLKQIIAENYSLLSNINPEKIKEEIKKCSHKEELIGFLSSRSIFFKQ